MPFVFMVRTLAMSWILTARSSSDSIITPFVGRLLYIVASIIANSLTKIKPNEEQGGKKELSDPNTLTKLGIWPTAVQYFGAAVYTVVT